MGLRLPTVAAAKAAVATSPTARLAMIAATTRAERTPQNSRTSTAISDSGAEISTPAATVAKLASASATGPVRRTR